VAVYAIGDVHGCFQELQALVQKIAFHPQHDRLWFVGDLINRGPGSLEVLRWVRDLGDRATVVLGNHEVRTLFGLSGAPSGLFSKHTRYILDAPDVAELRQWLFQLPLLHHDPELGWTMVHAALSPRWSPEVAQRHAALATARLRTLLTDPAMAARWFPRSFTSADVPAREPDTTDSPAWTRFCIDVMTRGRLCTADGIFLWPGTATAAGINPYALPDSPSGITDPDGTPVHAWFDQRQQHAPEQLLYGHWAMAGLVARPPHLFGLDSGAVYGGALTAVRLDDPSHPVTQIACPAYVRLNPEG
jgi:bis(5'-nucleosyl)-tetraphosphatase (symmetrical)